MADSLTVELVAADRTVWSGAATMVIARTVEGDIGVLRGHAPVLSLLSEAIVEITAEDGHTVVAVADGGFLSVAGVRFKDVAAACTDAVAIPIPKLLKCADGAPAVLADLRRLGEPCSLRNGRRCRW